MLRRVLNAPPGGGMVGSAQLRELEQRAHLIVSFACRDIGARYRQALLGMAWAVAVLLQAGLGLLVVFTVDRA